MLQGSTACRMESNKFYVQKTNLKILVVIKCEKKLNKIYK